jgi:hypothetical protein
MEELKKFINKNHYLVDQYHYCYFSNYITSNWRENIRICLLTSLNSGGIGKISEKVETIRIVEEKIKRMKNQNYEELLKVFNCTSYKHLFEKLKNLNQLGPKKSALFLRDILYFKNIIKNIPKNLQKKYLVPVDRVITRLINSLLDKNLKTDKKGFEEINNIAKKIFPNNPILLEDLWFWGRFYRCREDKKSNIPFCKFNKDLLEIDLYISQKFRETLLFFAKEHLECPFKNFCSKN